VPKPTIEKRARNEVAAIVLVRRVGVQPFDRVLRLYRETALKFSREFLTASDCSGRRPALDVNGN